MRTLSASESLHLLGSHEDLLVIDLRSLEDFSGAFIQGAIPFMHDLHSNMKGEPSFPKGVGVLFAVSKAAYEVAAVSFPSMDGWEILGSLPFDREEWMDAGGTIDMVIGVEPDELAMDIPFDDRLLIVDVRDPIRFSEEHAEGAVNLPLRSLFDPGSMAMLQETDNLYIHGEDDREGLLAAALLKRQGYHNLRVVAGGWDAMKREKGIGREKDPGKLN